MLRELNREEMLKVCGGTDENEGDEDDDDDDPEYPTEDDDGLIHEENEDILEDFLDETISGGDFDVEWDQDNDYYVARDRFGNTFEIDVTD